MSEKSKIAKQDDRTRNWTFVVYPDSAPDNWRDILDGEHIPWVESPLHDKCINPDGTPKKPHWHIALLFQTNKSFEQIQEFTDKLNAPIPQKVASAVGVIRYMAHMDNPEKTQYSPKNIKAHGGVDIARYLKITATSRYVAIKEMMDFVRNNNISEFHSLTEFAMEHRFDDWFPLLCDNSAYIIGQYIKSRRHGQAAVEVRTRYVDRNTGEVLDGEV
jgi:hypothetical protein